MTIDRSNAAVAASAEAARAESTDSAAAEVSATLGTLRVDRIFLSEEAHALVSAGLAVRAFVAAGLESIRRSLALGNGRTLVLERGIYGVT